MGKTSLAAFMATCPKLDTLKLLGAVQGSIDRFVAWTKENYPQITTIEIVDDLETLVRGSDIVTIVRLVRRANVSKYPSSSGNG